MGNHSEDYRVEMGKSLAGQVAWVTGSSRGLGRVMATKLCELGAAVAVHGTRFDSPKAFGEGDSMEQVAKEVATAAGGITMPVWGDVTDEAEVEHMTEAVRSRLGKIDILVTNAGGDIGVGGTGVGRGGRPSPDDCIGIPLADIKAVLDRNLLSCILCCRAVAPEMMARKTGRVITIGSVAGTHGRDDGAIYAVAKAAVHEYTRCLATQTAAVQYLGKLRRAGWNGDQPLSRHPRNRARKTNRRRYARSLRPTLGSCGDRGFLGQ